MLSAHTIETLSLSLSICVWLIIFVSCKYLGIRLCNYYYQYQCACIPNCMPPTRPKHIHYTTPSQTWTERKQAEQRKAYRVILILHKYICAKQTHQQMISTHHKPTKTRSIHWNEKPNIVSSNSRVWWYRSRVVYVWFSRSLLLCVVHHWPVAFSIFLASHRTRPKSRTATIYKPPKTHTST